MCSTECDTHLHFVLVSVSLRRQCDDSLLENGFGKLRFETGGVVRFLQLLQFTSCDALHDVKGHVIERCHEGAAGVVIQDQGEDITPLGVVVRFAVCLLSVRGDEISKSGNQATSFQAL